jgi:hypothetical protein
MVHVFTIHGQYNRQNIGGDTNANETDEYIHINWMAESARRWPAGIYDMSSGQRSVRSATGAWTRKTFPPLSSQSSPQTALEAEEPGRTHSDRYASDFFLAVCFESWP